MLALARRRQLGTIEHREGVAASTRTRSSSLAAISADSARSNAESIAEIFTAAKLNRSV